MIIAPQLSGLERISFYAAPSEHSPTPYTIPENIQIVELLTGGVVFFDDGSGMRSYRRGAFFWHVPGDKTICQTTREEPYRCEVFRFHAQSSDRIAPRVNFWRGSEESLQEFIEQTHTAYQETLTDPAAAQIMAAYCAGTLLMHALKITLPHSQTLEEATPDTTRQQLNHILNYIEKNPGSDLSSTSICQHCKLPRNRLFTLFRDHLQITPHEYIMTKRLELARRLLESTTEPIKEIASRCGFEHTEVFHRAFVKYYRETPKNYRATRAPYKSME